MKVLGWYIDLNGIENNKLVIYRYPIVIKNVNPHYKYSNGLKKENGAGPTLIQTTCCNR